MIRAGLNRRRFVGAFAGTAAGMSLPACDGGSHPSDAPTPPAPATVTGPPAPSATSSGPRPLYLGTYTSADGGGKGIGTATYDPVTGRISGEGVIGGVGDPSFLAVHPDGRTLYAVNEREDGAVTAVRLSDRKALGSSATGGSSPCHLSVHPGGRFLLSADYGSGTVAVHRIEQSGVLGGRTALVTHSEPAPGPGQQGPHAHQFVTAPDGEHVLAVDLGTDTVYTYRLDDKDGTLTEVSRAAARAGAGPRQLTFHPGGRYAYLANELDDTVTVCAYEPTSGRLTIGEPQPTGSEPEAGTNYPAQLVVTGDGRWAYLANRGHNSVARYAVEEDGARLRLLGTVPVGGDFPRHIALSPDGGLLFTANQRSGDVSVFHVDADSGELRPAGEPFASPVAVCALPL